MATGEGSEARRRWFAIAAIGRDRPGIVADLAECVYTCGCNLEDASMTALGSEFATLMLVSGTGADVTERLNDAAKHLESERRLAVFVRPLDNEPQPPGGPQPGQYALTAEGIDKAGIVAGVARCLADLGILIVDLRGAVVPIPQSGTPLYRLTIRMDVPPGIDVSELRHELATIAERLDVEIALTETE